jgi:hypothetical protein
MTKTFFVAICAIALLAANLPAKSESIAVPTEMSFPSSAGAVTFHHEMHVRDLGVKCVECHHSLNAKKLVTPHPDYMKPTSVKCERCHQSGAANQSVYTCSGCHGTNPTGIADETLSKKVVIHKQCGNCHAMGNGKDASKACEKCHTGKKKL